MTWGCSSIVSTAGNFRLMSELLMWSGLEQQLNILNIQPKEPFKMTEAVVLWVPSLLWVARSENPILKWWYWQINASILPTRTLCCSRISVSNSSKDASSFEASQLSPTTPSFTRLIITCTTWPKRSSHSKWTHLELLWVSRGLIQIIGTKS